MGIPRFPRLNVVPLRHKIAAVALALLVALSGGAWFLLHPNAAALPSWSLPSFHFAPHLESASSESASSGATSSRSGVSVQAPSHAQGNAVVPAHPPAVRIKPLSAGVQAQLAAIGARENFLHAEIHNIHSEELYRSSQNVGAAASHATPPGVVPALPSPRILALEKELQRLEVQKADLQKTSAENPAAQEASNSRASLSTKSDKEAPRGYAAAKAPAQLPSIPVSAPIKSMPLAAAKSRQNEASHGVSQGITQADQFLRAGLVVTGGFLAGILYLFVALWRFRPINSLAAFESLLPAEILLLGVVPEMNAEVRTQTA
jgi:hypothetical protein